MKQSIGLDWGKRTLRESKNTKAEVVEGCVITYITTWSREKGWERKSLGGVAKQRKRWGWKGNNKERKARFCAVPE